MTAFRYPPGAREHLNQVWKRQDHLVSKFSSEMEKVMKLAVDYIIDHWEKTGHYAAPSLASLNQIMDYFYRQVVQQAFECARMATPRPHIKRLYDGRSQDFMRLTGGKWPIGIPKNLVGLEKIFRDQRYWPKIMKRSKLITDRVRKEYLKKLQKKFKKVLPSLTSGEMTPQDAKSVLMETWSASKSRVELIFRTETTTYFGKTQTAFFADDPEIIGFLFDSIRDRARTDWCRTRHGIVYRPGTKELTENTPALHWNCRSHLIPLANTAYNRKLLSDPQRDPSNRKVAPLPAGWRK